MNDQERSPRQRQVADFIGNLEQLDAGGRARLKRNAGRRLHEARDIARVFFQALPYDIPERAQEDYFLVATLFPLAPHRASRHSLGRTLRRVRSIRGGTEQSNSLDRRFQTLIDSDREQLPFRLRQAVRLAAADDQLIDWERLLLNVLNWEHPDHFVQLQWARDYFVGIAEEPAPAPDS